MGRKWCYLSWGCLYIDGLLGGQWYSSLGGNALSWDVVTGGHPTYGAGSTLFLLLLLDVEPIYLDGFRGDSTVVSDSVMGESIMLRFGRLILFTVVFSLGDGAALTSTLYAVGSGCEDSPDSCQLFYKSNSRSVATSECFSTFC